MTIDREVPRWARLAAHAAALTTVPSGLWRIGLAFGLPLGFSDRVLRDYYGSPGSGSFYLIGLSLFLEALALLTLGLVRPWGEVAPTWLPFVGGRVIPVRVVVIAAGTGSALLSLLWIPMGIGWWFVTGDPPLSPTAHIMVGLLYQPLMAWGPLLAAVTVAYRRRRDVKGSDATGSDATGSDVKGSDVKGSDATGSRATGRDVTGPGATGPDVGHGTPGSGAACSPDDRSRVRRVSPTT